MVFKEGKERKEKERNGKGWKGKDRKRSRKEGRKEGSMEGREGHERKGE